MENYNIQIEIDKKRIQNKQYSKEYKIDYENKKVIKYKKNSKCMFEIECVKFLCEYYKNNLNLDFDVKYINECLVTVSPFVVTAYELNIPSDLSLTKNTINILENFNRKNIFLNKICNNDFTIKIFCDSYNTNNFFIFNNEAYLLDLEGFYFCVYDKNNNSVGKLGIKEEYLSIIKDYYIPEESFTSIFNENMLIY